MADTVKFQTGKTYSVRSLVDYDSVYSFTILGRTEKSVSVEVRGKEVRRGLRVCEGVEQFKPFGSYSMCPVVFADRTSP